VKTLIDLVMKYKVDGLDFEYAASFFTADSN